MLRYQGTVLSKGVWFPAILIARDTSRKNRNNTCHSICLSQDSIPSEVSKVLQDGFLQITPEMSNPKWSLQLGPR